MKEITYTCNHCKRKFLTDSELITFGTNNDEIRVFYKNPNAEINQIKELGNHGNLHFCSKDCFVGFFFDTEEKP